MLDTHAIEIAPTEINNQPPQQLERTSSRAWLGGRLRQVKCCNQVSAVIGLVSCMFLPGVIALIGGLMGSTTSDPATKKAGLIMACIGGGIVMIEILVILFGACAVKTLSCVKRIKGTENQ